jgi:Flp pilus assembly pilin Flp
MICFKNRLERWLSPSFLNDDRGLSTVEYTIILVLIAVAGIGLWSTFGDTLAEKITDSNTQLDSMEVPANNGRTQ